MLVIDELSSYQSDSGEFWVCFVVLGLKIAFENGCFLSGVAAPKRFGWPRMSIIALGSERYIAHTTIKWGLTQSLGAAAPKSKL